MKIGIVTFVRTGNYGAELQAYALQKKLNLMGFDAEVLDLEKEQRMLESSRRTIIAALLNRIKYYGLFSGICHFFSLFRKKHDERKAYHANIEKSKEKQVVFDVFFYNLIKHSPKHYTLDELYTEELPYNIYIAGSDQIWNYMQTRRLDVFFLQFANRFKAKKIAYAASFSVSSIPKGLKMQYKSLIENMDIISVREKNAIDIIKDCSSMKAVQVLDPTLLLTREEWMKYVGIDDYVSFEDKYVLIYSLSKSRYIYTLAKRIAKELGAIVINIKNGYSFYKEEKGIKHIMNAGPKEFVTLFNQASYVVTDSFHGTAFSVNFNIPFTTLLNPVSNINSRALSILELTKLKDTRLMYDDGKQEMPKSLIVDFYQSNQIINEHRKESIEFIISALN